MTKKYRLIMAGFGNVGKATARLLLKKQKELSEVYGIEFVVTGIATARHGRAINPEGIDLVKALAAVEDGGSLDGLSVQPCDGDMVDFIRSCPGDVLFEITPVNHKTGQPAIDHMKTALEMGMHAITANKGPVAHAYQMLSSLAKEKNRRFLFESAVMDGAPVFSIFIESLIGANLLGFTGILNSCTNLLLDLMGQGQSLEEAIAYGASIGITETDPSNDVDGWDAAIKVAALCTVLMHHPITPQEVDRTGIRGITAPMIQEALAAGERWKLVCSANLEDGKLTARVRPERVNSESPLFNVGGTSSFVLLKTDVLPGLGLLESNTEPETTAYGLLADFINAVTH